MLFDEWRDPLVRDLSAVMALPGLLDHGAQRYRGCVVDDAWCRGCHQIAAAALGQLDQNPEPLRRWVSARKTGRLGSYFEALVEYWLTELLGYQLVAHNEVICEGKRQLGEFDFLFRQHRDAALVHWEVTVKYYLWFEGDFIGPNARDRLQRKVDRVFDHQLHLSEKEQARKQLERLCGDDSVIPKAFFKGMLFYPCADTNCPALVGGLSARHERGWWCRFGELKQWLTSCSSDSRWIILPRLRWLAHCYSNDENDLQDSVALALLVESHFYENHTALMVAELARKDDGWFEVGRGVIVNDQWPQPLTTGL